jgi:hypothetical protein
MVKEPEGNKGITRQQKNHRGIPTGPASAYLRVGVVSSTKFNQIDRYLSSALTSRWFDYCLIAEFWRVVIENVRKREETEIR